MNTGTAPGDPQEAAALFARYIRAWNAGDCRQIATDVYQTPVYVFEPDDTRILDTPEAIVALLSGLRKDLDAAGFTHSTVEHVGTCDLGSGLMLATFHYRRHFAGPAAATPEDVLASAYILRRYPVGWRLVAHVVQSRVAELVCTRAT